MEEKEVWNRTTDALQRFDPDATLDNAIRKELEISYVKELFVRLVWTQLVFDRLM